MRIAILAALLSLAGCTTPTGNSAPVTFANPVLDENFPDPAVLRARDGYYYVYATQGEHDGRMVNIQAARSRDLVRWERIPDVLPTKPRWASKTQDFWRRTCRSMTAATTFIIQPSRTRR
jgi:arabinan endo-1,5-alpha-L-arabinosidase